MISVLGGVSWLGVSFVACRLSYEIIAKPSRDEARPPHNCANIARSLHFGRDGLCPVHFREGFAIASGFYAAGAALRLPASVHICPFGVFSRKPFTEIFKKPNLHAFKRFADGNSTRFQEVYAADLNVMPIPPPAVRAEKANVFFIHCANAGEQALTIRTGFQR